MTRGGIYREIWTEHKGNPEGYFYHILQLLFQCREITIYAKKMDHINIKLSKGQEEEEKKCIQLIAV